MHSQFSPLDGMPKVGLIVNKAHVNGDPACGLTDHGQMGGVVQLYLECKKRGMKPYPGFEGYLIDPMRNDWENPAKGAAPVGRYHFGLLALNEDGYKALVRFVSMTHTRPRFNRFARCTLNDLVKLGKDHGENLAMTSGCYFGLIQSMIARGMDEMARRYVELLSEVFPNYFIEVQHHNICHDDQPDEDEELIGLDDTDMVERLFELADEYELPVIATQDSHYLDQKHKAAHSLMKRMTYGGADDAFPGDSFHVASAEWVAEHYEQWQWDRIEEGFAELLELNTLSIAPLDNFKPDLPYVCDDPAGEMRELVEDQLEDYLAATPNLKKPEKVYWDQLDHEMEVIEKLNMPPYFLIVEDYVRASQEREICVEARGSANGSLAAFVMGITQTDPVEWGGMFERFLSEDRIKPPDIDLDIEDEERGWLIRYLLNKYPGSVQIGTYSMMGITVDPETGEEKGSVLQSYLTSLRRQCDEIAAKKVSKAGDRKAYSQAVFRNKYGDIKGIEDVREHSLADWRALKMLSDMQSVYRSYGVHAGGVLLPGTRYDIDDYIPTMLVASSDTRVTMFDMDDVEQFGFLKMDILGQSSLRMMKLCMENIAKSGYEVDADSNIDFDWIPLDDPNACKLLREGRTNTGIFHYEGYTKAKGGRELKIKSTEDAVMGQALFMPGAMNTGQKDLYIERRNSAAARKAVTYISPEFEAALKHTYGTVIFQEQVIDIMRNLGMDIASINTFFKVVKDSGKGATERNAQRLAEVREQFEQHCLDRGITDLDAAWGMTAGFVSYGFNRAHASGYGIRSYRTAYLKAYYPTEFMAALLQTWSGKEKEKKYISEARRIGIRLLPPDVNVSGKVWTQDHTRDGVIRKGLLSIPGVGPASAEAIANASPFDSIEDMIARIPAKQLTGGKVYLAEGRFTGTLRALDDVGALDSLKGD